MSLSLLSSAGSRAARPQWPSPASPGCMGVRDHASRLALPGGRPPLCSSQPCGRASLPPVPLKETWSISLPQAKAQGQRNRPRGVAVGTALIGWAPLADLVQLTHSLKHFVCLLLPLFTVSKSLSLVSVPLLCSVHSVIFFLTDQNGMSSLYIMLQFCGSNLFILNFVTVIFSNKIIHVYHTWLYLFS